MKLYLITDGHGPSCYRGTLADAHEIAKDSYDRFDVRIEQVEVDTDRENLLRILNEEGGFQSPVFRSWVLSPRGALRPGAED